MPRHTQPLPHKQLTAAEQRVADRLFSDGETAVYLVLHDDGTGYLLAIGENIDFPDHGCDLLGDLYAVLGQRKIEGVDVSLVKPVNGTKVRVDVKRLSPSELQNVLPLFAGKGVSRVYDYRKEDHPHAPDNMLESKVDWADFKEMVVNWEEELERRAGPRIERAKKEVCKWLANTQGCITALILDHEGRMEIRHYSQQRLSPAQRVKQLSRWLAETGWQEDADAAAALPRNLVRQAPAPENYSMATLRITDPEAQMRVEELFADLGIDKTHMFKVPDVSQGLSSSQLDQLFDQITPVNRREAG